MEKYRDFRCGYSNSVGICPEVTEPLGLEFPDAYKHRETMAQLSRAIKEHDNDGYCLLPFCRTCEAEAMGATINLGNEVAGPRASEPVYKTLEELKNLPEIDFSQGRIHEVLEACRMLVDEGEHVGLEIVGPWTMLSALIDPRYLFKFYRRNREELVEVMHFIGTQLFRYIDEARERGVELIVLSDSAGTMNILGPKMGDQSLDDFMVWFCKGVVEHLGDQMVCQLCPKFVYNLIDTGRARFEEHQIEPGTTFLNALLENRKDVKLVGQTCIKLPGARLMHGKLRELVIL